MATRLFDLLTAHEEQVDLHTREHRFDLSLLTRRSQDATTWAMAQPGLQHAPVGYFGASTGSAAAIIAASWLGKRIAAVVSRGGRPDLAGPVALAAVKAPTLLIVGGADHGVIELNEQTLLQLTCDKKLAVVPICLRCSTKQDRAVKPEVGGALPPPITRGVTPSATWSCMKYMRDPGGLRRPGRGL